MAVIPLCSAGNGLISVSVIADDSGPRYITGLILENRTTLRPLMSVRVPTNPDSATAPVEIVDQLEIPSGEQTFTRALPTRRFRVTIDADGVPLIPFQVTLSVPAG